MRDWRHPLRRCCSVRDPSDCCGRSCLIALGLPPASPRQANQPAGDRERRRKNHRFENRAPILDADAIGLAHVDSIKTIGAGSPPPVVDDWAEGLAGDVYVEAIGRRRGVLHCSRRLTASRPSSASRRTIALKVRSTARRCTCEALPRDRGIRSALLRLAEAEAAVRGPNLHPSVEASLAGVRLLQGRRLDEVAR